MRLKRTDTDVDAIAGMDRDALTRAILSIECEFPVDLTEESLRPLSLEKLRHIYTALLRHGKRPGG